MPADYGASPLQSCTHRTSSGVQGSIAGEELAWSYVGELAHIAAHVGLIDVARICGHVGQPAGTLKGRRVDHGLTGISPPAVAPVAAASPESIPTTCWTGRHVAERQW